MASRTEAELLDEVYELILDGDADGTVALVEESLADGADPSKLLFDAMIPSLEEVGNLFETEVYFLPEMLTSANAMKAAMEVLRPHLGAEEAEQIGTFLIGTVAGDIHDIGKNMCGVMLEGAGFKVIDIGINVPAADFVEAIKTHQPDVVGMSAFLTTTVPEIDNNLAAFEEAGVRDSVKVMVGGAPVTEDYAIGAGADAYAPDASSAARVAKALISPG